MPHVPASAQVQMGGGGEDSDPMQNQVKEQKKAQSDIDKQYRSTMQRTSGGQTAPTRTDPWANMRGTPAPAETAKKR